jgi:hypothetical protein
MDKTNVLSMPGGASLNDLGKAFDIKGVQLVDDAAVRQGDDLAILFNLFLETTLPDNDWRSDGATGTVVVHRSERGIEVKEARIEGVDVT